jgi:tripartite-type tricarboxylate transporter receptor subunit TctC
MSQTGRFISTAAAAVLAACAGIATGHAADVYPSKPVHIIVPTVPGGALDLTTRIVAQKMSENLGQPVVVENRPGADTMLGTRFVKDVAPDGYYILATSNGINALPSLKEDPGFDPGKDFTGIGNMSLSSMLLDEGTDKPDKTLADFIARAKAHPDQVTLASGGVGSAPHLACAAMLQKAGVEITHVVYKGNGAALPDVAGGRVDIICDAYISSAGYLKSGKLKALAVSGEHRSSALPDVPTYKEAGIDASYPLWLGLVAPVKTPPEVVKRLSDALHYATTSKEVGDRMKDQGSEPGIESPEEFNKFLANDRLMEAALVAALKLPKE